MSAPPPWVSILGIKPRRIDAATRIFLALLSRFFNWRNALAVVRPETMIRWRRAGWKLFWRLRSRSGRPPIPRQIQTLIRRMANENPAWGEQRIANEFLVKLGIWLSPRTVSKYLSRCPPGRPRGDLRWSTFLRLHAPGIIACDFLVTVTATQCGRICIGRRKINLSQVFAGQNVGIKEVAEKIWLVSFMDYDLGFFDHEVGRVECAPNPFGAKLFLASNGHRNT